ncbi:MAG: MFS transporter [Candidatus Thermoplasmatota archaeon]|uniref:MFS transporter n=2 Tax=Ferroplasma TaxID=74968 RepID=UPI002638CBC4|nr:MFS transporter [Ferroplasma sp.]MCL4312448.1 MFS transporter [Candidatus Thermoplasmatota archaeon]
MEIKNSRPVLPAVLQSMFIIALGNLIDSSYAPMAPFIKNFYVLTATQVGLVTSVIFIGSSCVSIFTGYFVDRIGYRNAMKLSFGIMAAGSLIVFKSPYYITLLLGFYLIGFGYGVLTPATNSHIMEEYSPEHLTRMGIKQAGVPMGAAMASIALPFIVLRAGVPYTYLVVSIFAIFVVLILPYRKKHNSSKFNVREYISEMLKAGKSRNLLIIGFSALFLSWSQQSVMTYDVLYFQKIKFGTIIAESFLITVLLSAIFGRILWTRLGNIIFRENHMATFSIIMFSTALVLLAFPHFSSYIYYAYIFSVLIGLTAISWNGVFVSIISEIAPPGRVGMFSGMGILIISLGTIIGTPISGLIIDHYHSYDLMWTVMGLTILAVSIILFFISMKIKFSMPTGK